MFNKVKGLGDELREFAKGLVVDIDPLGIENLIHQHARNFVEKESINLEVSPDQIRISLYKEYSGNIKSHILIDSNFNRKISLEELISFFVGDEQQASLKILNKVINGISLFIQDYCKNKKLNTEEVSFQISTTKDKIYLESFSKENTEKIKIKSLIKYIHLNE